MPASTPTHDKSATPRHDKEGSSTSPHVVATNASRSAISSTSASAPPRSTTTTSSAARTRTRAERQCDRCVQLLQQVLEHPTSKPAQLLRSMSSAASTTASISSDNNTISWRKSPNGIQVEIPEAPTSTTTTTTTTSGGRIIEADPENTDDIGNMGGGQPASLLRRITRQWSSAGANASSNNNTATASIATFDAVDSKVKLAATSTRTSNENSPSNSNSNSNKTEWMSLQCRPCLDYGAESNARAFVMGPTPLSVVVCSNRLQHATTEEMQEIITHELMHIFDVRRLHLNLLDCPTLAYSEVRAAREAECHNHNNTSWFPFQNHSARSLQHCVRQKATVATRNLFPWRAKSCIDTVFEQAFADQRPFVAQKQPQAADSNHESNKIGSTSAAVNDSER